MRDPGVLEQQVRRMLRDRRSQAVLSNFAAEWLSLRALERPSQIRMCSAISTRTCGTHSGWRRSFSSKTSGAEDRSVLEFLDADYTFVNNRLPEHYQIPGVYGSPFRRVTVSDGKRGGLLGQGAILTATSYDNRTSPSYAAQVDPENLLGTPPPRHHRMSRP